MPIITENIIYSTMSQNILLSQLNLQNIQIHTSSGSRVMEPSDDPLAASQSVLLDSSLNQLSTMDAAASQVNLQLNTADEAIRLATNTLTRARELLIQANNSTLTPENKAYIANEMQGLHDTMLSLANSNINGVYIFGGYVSDSAPFATDGTYNGDAGVRKIEVAPNIFADMNIPGDQIFNPTSGKNIIGALQDAATSLSNNDLPGIAGSLTAVVDGFEQISSGRVTVGRYLNTLNTAETIRQDTYQYLTENRSSFMDTDLAKSFTDLMQAQVAYEAAISVTTRMLSTLSNVILG